VQWQVNDRRVSPFMSAPSEVTTGLDAGFMVRVEDPNGETLPLVSVESFDTAHGEFIAEKILEDNGPNQLSNQRPSALYFIEWKGLNESHYGISADVVVSACVRSSSWNSNKDLCSRNHTQISIEKAVRTAQLLVLSPEKEVKEGEKLDVQFRVVNDAFDPMALSVVTEDAPEGLVVKRDTVDASIFHLKYAPNHSVVDLSNVTADGRFGKEVSFLVRVLGPTGTMNETDFDWTVLDERLAPNISAPASVTQGLDVNFTIRTEDLNGEEVPQVMVNQNVPFGSLQIDLLSTWPGIPGVALPSSLYNVKWTGITEAEYGRNFNLNFVSCTHSAPGLMTNCKNAVTRVSIERNTASNGANP
jgi:hypothetical protein